MKNKKVKKIFVEVAKTPDKMSRGLMFRDHLEEDSGMLFVFQQPKVLSFWGMNTFIPLDIAFIDDNGVIRDIKRIKKHDLNSIKSSCPCKYAIEMEDGWFLKNGFKPGDFAEISSADIDNSIFIVKNTLDNKYAQKVDELDPEAMQNPDEVEQSDYEGIDEDEDDLEEVEDFSINQAVEDLDNDTAVESPARSGIVPTVGVLETPPKFNNIFEALRWSGQNRQVIRITYKTKKGHIITRDIEPYKVFFSRKSGRQVLKSFDETSSKPRFYIIMNISSFGFPGRKFVPKFIFNNRR
jgi:uncharacterized membrane protein (UPF0127 family)